MESSIFGYPPKIMDTIPLATENAEMCFIQDMPICVPVASDNLTLHIPDALEWTLPVIEASLHDYNKDYGFPDKGIYIYISVRSMYGVGNRGGWHTDGYGTDDINYIWYDAHPTLFCIHTPFTIRNDNPDSMDIMASKVSTGNVTEFPCTTLLRLDAGVIHSVNPEWFGGMRNFIKVSISDKQYNLIGNTHNPLIDYKWVMRPRTKERNYPTV